MKAPEVFRPSVGYEERRLVTPILATRNLQGGFPDSAREQLKAFQCQPSVQHRQILFAPALDVFHQFVHPCSLRRMREAIEGDVIENGRRAYQKEAASRKNE